MSKFESFVKGYLTSFSTRHAEDKAKKLKADERRADFTSKMDLYSFKAEKDLEKSLALEKFKAEAKDDTNSLQWRTAYKAGFKLGLTPDEVDQHVSGYGSVKDFYKAALKGNLGSLKKGETIGGVVTEDQQKRRMKIIAEGDTFYSELTDDAIEQEMDLRNSSTVTNTTVYGDVSINTTEGRNNLRRFHEKAKSLFNKERSADPDAEPANVAGNLQELTTNILKVIQPAKRGQDLLTKGGKLNLDFESTVGIEEREMAALDIINFINDKKDRNRNNILSKKDFRPAEWKTINFLARSVVRRHQQEDLQKSPELGGRVDPSTLSVGKTYKLPDGRIVKWNGTKFKSIR